MSNKTVSLSKLLTRKLPFFGLDYEKVVSFFGKTTCNHKLCQTLYMWMLARGNLSNESKTPHDRPRKANSL